MLSLIHILGQVRALLDLFTPSILRVNLGEARALLGVLYSCYLREEEVLYTTYIFAEDVNIDLISVIKEKNLPGVESEPMTTREYETDYAAILLGQVGAISAESWEEKKDYYEKNDYTMDAIIGPVSYTHLP